MCSLDLGLFIEGPNKTLLHYPYDVIYVKKYNLIIYQLLNISNWYIDF